MFEVVEVNELFKRAPDLKKETLASYLNDCYKMIKKDLANKKIESLYNSDDYPNYDIFLNDINKGMYFAIYRKSLVGSITIGRNDIKEEFGFENDDKAYQDFIKRCDIDENNYYTLHRLFVLPEYQNMGVAKQIFKTIEENLKDTTIIFLVSPFNIPAIKLYEKLNYENLGSYPFYYGNYVIFKKKI